MVGHHQTSIYKWLFGFPGTHQVQVLFFSHHHGVLVENGGIFERVTSFKGTIWTMIMERRVYNWVRRIPKIRKRNIPSSLSCLMALGFAPFYPDSKVSPKIRFKLDSPFPDDLVTCGKFQLLEPRPKVYGRWIQIGSKYGVQEKNAIWVPLETLLWSHSETQTYKSWCMQPAAGISKASYFLLFSLHISSDITFNTSRLTFTISPFPSSTLLFKKPFLINALGQDVVNDSGMIWKNSGQGQLLLCPLMLSFYS